MPTEAMFVVALVPVGALAVFFGSVANAHMQMCSAPVFRGRVMALYTILTMGSTVLGGPLVGWICQQWSPRAAFGLAGTVTVAAATGFVVTLPLGRRRPELRPAVTD
jgi:MFS family permease